MKICWDNLERLRYNQETKKWYYTGLTYIYVDSCETCKEPFLLSKYHKGKNKYCCRECIPARLCKVNSPTITVYNGPFDFIQVRLTKSNEDIGLVVYYSAQPLAGGWKFFHSCYDINSTKLKTEVLDRK